MELKKNEKIKLIGFNYKDNFKNASSFLKNLGNPYDIIVLDKDGTESIEWGAYGVPESFLIYQNKIIKRFIGPINNQSLSEINKIVGAFSSGMGGTSTKSSRKSKKDIDILMGSKSKTKPVKFFSDPKPPKRGKRKHKPKSNVDILMGSKPKGRKNKSVKIYSDRNNVRVF